MFIFSQSFGVISLLSAHLTTLIWDQPWDFFGRNDAKAETPVLWPPQAKSWLIGKDSDAGRDCGQEEKGTTEDEMAGWHYRLHGCEFEWTPGVCDGQGGLACCSLWGHNESDTTEQLNWIINFLTDKKPSLNIFSAPRSVLGSHIRMSINALFWSLIYNKVSSAGSSEVQTSTVIHGSFTQI